MPGTIEGTELQSKQAAGSVVVIDTLHAPAFARGHIPGAINIPCAAIVDRAPELLPDKHAEIVVYCKNGPCKRSEKAAARLTSLGSRRVRDYHEGRDDWGASGLPLERETAHECVNRSGRCVRRRRFRGDRRLLCLLGMAASRTQRPLAGTRHSLAGAVRIFC